MSKVLVILAVVVTGWASWLATAPEAAATPAKSPLKVALTGPEKVAVGETIAVVLTIERMAFQNLEVQWQVALPAGARAVPGEPQAGVLPAGARPNLVQTLHLMVDELPKDDLVVTVRMAGNGMGLQSKATYRFGRTAPVGPRPSPVPVPGKVNGKKIGATIPLPAR